MIKSHVLSTGAGASHYTERVEESGGGGGGGGARQKCR